MASPQKENGHLSIATELVEVFSQLHLSGNEWQVIWAVLRKTWGWNKKEDWISLTQLEKLTGLSNRAVCRAQLSLVSKNIIFKRNSRLSFNKNYHQWVLSKMTVSKMTVGTVKNVSTGTVKNDSNNKHYTINTNTITTMKDKRHFLNERRKERGLPPIEHTATARQLDFIQRSKLIKIFQDAVNEVHSKSYFTHPSDIADLEKENSRINGQIKLFWGRCDKDIKKATEVIHWYASDFGKFQEWSPGFCFRKETVVAYENRGSGKNRREVFEL